MNRRNTRIGRLGVALATVTLASSCSVSFDDGQVSFVDEDAQLLCDEGSSVTLAAQAVPTAEHIPCLAELPAGWSVDYTDFEHDGVEIKIDSRRAPIDDIVLLFSETCTAGAEMIADVIGTVQIPDGFAVSQDVDGLDTRLVLAGPGGCTELQIELEAAEAVTLDDFPTITWIPRAAIDAGVAAATDDRLRLDP